MNQILSIASELLQHEVHQYYNKRPGEVLEPLGLIFRGNKARLMPPPPDMTEIDPYKLLISLACVNNVYGSMVSGIAHEVFFVCGPDKMIDDYKYGSLNENNSKSGIIIYLQEKVSKEKYFAMAELDKTNNSIKGWIETDGAIIGGDLYNMELYG